MAEDDFGERFIELNANVEFMSDHLADFLRNCMRAAAATDPSAAVGRATQEFAFLLRLLAKAQSPNLHDLVSRAVKDLTVQERGDVFTEAVIRSAEKGVRFLVESSCIDNAARGRASRREQEFLDAIERIGDARATLNKQYLHRR
ncbi:MAG TPA: hypothetical protein VGM87_02140 [Roseomonas sp.]